MAQLPATFSDEQLEIIERMASVGVPRDQIAMVIGVSEPTLRKYCAGLMDRAAVTATANVAKSLYNQAMRGNTAAMIFWLKARAKWSERVEVTGKDGKDLLPIGIDEQTDLARRIGFALAVGAAQGALGPQGPSQGTISPLPTPQHTLDGELMDDVQETPATSGQPGDDPGAK